MNRRKRTETPAVTNTEVFVMDSAANYIGVGDEVRIGQGDALYRIVSVDDDLRTLRMFDDVTGRNRKADKGQVTLCIESNEAYAARAEQGLFNIF